MVKLVREVVHSRLNTSLGMYFQLLLQLWVVGCNLLHYSGNVGIICILSCCSNFFQMLIGIDAERFVPFQDVSI